MSAPAKSNLSFLGVLDICDNVHLRSSNNTLQDAAFDSEQLVPLYLTESMHSPVIGLLRPIILKQLKAENIRSNQLNTPELWVLRLVSSDFQPLNNGTLGPSVCFKDTVNSPAKRTEALVELCERWRDSGLFEDVCGITKWRAEMYPIYANPFGVHDHPADAVDTENLNYVFEMERSACALFGVVTYGVHMNIFEEVIDESGNKTLRIWVPTRASTKPTFPGYLDNTVAGGIPSGMSVLESLFKECMEEASITEDIARQYVRPVGAISYFFRTSKGWLQPEIEYVYDLLIPAGVSPEPFRPKPLDGEVECFELMDQSKVIVKLRQGLFKPNCGLVLIDLFIRLGYVTPENEPDYTEIVTRLHGRFDYDKW